MHVGILLFSLLTLVISWSWFTELGSISFAVPRGAERENSVWAEIEWLAALLPGWFQARHHYLAANTDTIMSVS